MRDAAAAPWGNAVTKLLGLAILLSSLSWAHAATELYWDADGNGSAATGGTANWDLTTARWRLNSPTGALQVWAQNANAHFPANLGTVTLTAAIQANGIFFETNGYTIQSNTLTLTGQALMDAVPGATGTVTSGVVGTVGLVKNNTGTVVLQGAGVTYTGVTNVTSGRLILRDTTNQAIGAAAKCTFTTAAAATLEFNITAGQKNLGCTGNAEFNGTGTLQKTGAGLLCLGDQGNSTFTDNLSMTGGMIDIQGGTLRNGGWQGQNWTANRATVNIGASGTLDIWDGNQITMDALTGSGTVTRGIPGTSTFIIGANNGSGTFSGSIVNGSGSLGFTKNGSGSQTLSGASTFSGPTPSVTVNGGSIVVQHPQALGSSTASNALQLNNGATLGLDMPATTGGLLGQFYNSNPGDLPTLAALNTFQNNTAPLTLGAPNAGRTSAISAINFTDGGANTPPFSSLGTGQDNPVAAVWRGKINIAATQAVTFYTNSDDNSFVFIDNNNFPVVSNGGAHGNVERSGTVNLTAGFHDIAVYYLESGGGATMQLSYSSSSPLIAKQIIPASVLIPATLPTKITTAGTVTIQQVNTAISNTLGAQISNNGTSINFSNSTANPLFAAANISGGGSITNSGTGTVFLCGNNSYSGGTTVSTGKLISKTNTTLGTNIVTLSGGTLGLGVSGSINAFGVGGTNWTLAHAGGGNVATITQDLLRITDGVGNEANSAFFNTQQNVASGFVASFIYKTAGGADGATFCVQNAAGNAIGAPGGGLGYSGIVRSFALCLNIYGPNTIGIAGGINGVIPPAPYASIAPVNLAGGNPIGVQVGYDPLAQTVTAVFTEFNTTNVFTRVFTGINLQTILTGTNAWIGFTGGTGGVASTQEFTNFQFTPFTGGSSTYTNGFTVPAGAAPTIEMQAFGLTCSGTLTFNNGAATTFNVTGGGLPANLTYRQSFSGTIQLNNNVTFNVFNNGTGTGRLLLGTVQDGGTARTTTKAQAGVLTFANNTGLTTTGNQVNVTAGTLESNNTQAMGTRTRVDLAAGTQFNVGASQQFSQLTGSGNTNLSTFNLTLGSNTDNLTFTYNGAISGTGAILKDGTGTLTLGGHNSYSGGSTIIQGKLSSNLYTSLGTGTVTMNNSNTTLSVAAGAVTGFGGNGTGWQQNGGSGLIAADVLTLTDNTGGLARSAFNATRFPVGNGFTTSFVYRATGGNPTKADGATLCIQNLTPAIVGAAGGNLGYGGITPSTALELNIYPFATGGVGVNFATNGATGTYLPVSPVALDNGNGILVQLVYDSAAQTMTQTLTDQTTLQTSTRTYTGINLATILGSSNAFIGFTGGTGGSTSTQTVSSFSFAPAAYPNNISVGGGVNPATVELRSPAIRMAALNAGGGSHLRVNSSGLPANSPYTLTIPGTLTVAGQNFFEPQNNGTGVGTLLCTGNTAGTTDFNKADTGTMILLGNNASLVNNINVNGGTLQCGNNSQLQFAGSLGANVGRQIAIANGATLDLQGRDIACTNAPTVMNGGTLRVSGFNFFGNITCQNNPCSIILGNGYQPGFNTMSLAGSFAVNNVTNITSVGTSNVGIHLAANTDFQVNQNLFVGAPLLNQDNNPPRNGQPGGFTKNGGGNMTVSATGQCTANILMNSGTLTAQARNAFGTGNITANSNTIALDIPTAGTGLYGQYYSQNSGDLPSIAAVNAFQAAFSPIILSAPNTGLLGSVGNININAGAAPPFASVGTNQDEPVTAIWTGRINIATLENVTFYSNSDDGSFVFIDGALVVNNGGLHGNVEIAGTVNNMTAGLHDIVVAYYEAGGGATMQLSYSSPTIPKQIIPTSVLTPTIPAIHASPLGIVNNINGNGGMTLRLVGASNSFTGLISGNGGPNFIVNTVSANMLGITNQIQAPGLFTMQKTGPGGLMLGGFLDNINAQLDLQAGQAHLNKVSNANVHAIARTTNMTVGTLLVLSGTGGDQIYDGGGFGIQNLNGTFNMNSRSEAFDNFFGAATGIVTNNGNAPSTMTFGIGNSAATFSGGIQNGTQPVSIVKNGTGTPTFNGLNSNYTGTTTINAGGLVISALNDSGSSSMGHNGAVTMANGSLLRYNSGLAGVTGRNWTITGTVTIDEPNGAGSLTLNGSFSGGTLQKQGGGLIQFGGSADNAGLILNVQGGTAVLAKTSSATVHAVSQVSNVNGGSTLRLGGSGGDQINDLNAGVLNMNGTFDLNGQSENIDQLTGSGNTTSPSAATLGIGVNNSSFTVSGPIQNALALTKLGSGNIILNNGGNTYSGDTTITAGVLRYGQTAAIPSGAGKGNVIDNATLDVNGFSPTINGLSGNGLVTCSVGGTLTLTVGANNATSTFSGIIQNGSATSVALTKTGTGALTLSGNNTYSGGSNISNGILSVGSIADAGNSNLANAGTLTLGATGTLQYTGATLGTTGRALNLSTGGTVEVTNAAGTVEFANAANNANPLNKTGPGALTLSGTGDNVSLRVAVAAGTLNLNKTSTSGVHAVAGITSVNAGALVKVTGTGGDQIYDGSGFGVFSMNGTLDLNGTNEGIDALTGTTGVVTNSSTSAASTISIGTSNGTSTYDGIFANGASQTLALTKVGVGSLTLFGLSTYTGGTTVNAGVLITSTILDGGPNNIGPFGSLTIANVGTLRYISGVAAITSRPITCSNGATFDVTGTGTLTLSSSISAGGNFTVNKAGIGTLELAGVTDNAFLGMNVIGGTLLLSKASTGSVHAVAQITNVAAGATLRLSGIGGDQIFDGSPFGVFSVNGTFELNGVNEGFDGISGAGTITNNGGGASVLTLGTSNASSTFAGVIQDGTQPLALTKVGTGTLTLSNTNTFSGNTTLSAGSLRYGATGAIPSGAGKGNVVMSAATTLDVNGLSPTVNGLSGAGTVQSNSAGVVTFTVGGNNATATFNGLIQNNLAGTFSLTKIGGGIQTLGGGNAYNGDTTISAGTLAYGSAAPAAIPSGAGNGNVIIASGATLDLNANSPTINGLFGAGAISSNVAGSATLNAGSNNISSTFDGAINNGSGTVALNKIGTGTLTLSNLSSSTLTGASTVTAGMLLVHGTFGSGGSVAVNNTATLGGNGTVGAIAGNSGGKVAPGASPGILNSGNVVLDAGSALELEFNNPIATAGADYDQLNVVGSVQLNNATLTVVGTPTTTLAPGATLTLIRNDSTDAVTGAFAGRANASSISIGSNFMHIYYAGGDGNDVTLITNRAPTAAIASATYSVNEGASVVLDGTPSSDPDTASGTLTYEWDFGSGFVNLGPTPTFSAATRDDGPVIVTLRVTDDGGLTSLATTTVTVLNVTPELNNAAVTASITENGTVHLTGNIVDPGTLDTFVLTVNWGEGAPQTYSFGPGATPFDVTHQYLDDNPTATSSDIYSITATIRDDDQGANPEFSAGVSTTVNNQAPAFANVAVTPSIVENSTVTLTGNIVDPGAQDTFTLVVNWGEGAPQTFNYPAGTASFSLTHQYLDDVGLNGPNASRVYNVHLDLVDDDQALTPHATADVSTTVNNAAPVVAVTSVASPLNENGMTTLIGTISDIGTLDTFVLAVDWGDPLSPNNIEFYNFPASATPQSFMLTHQYLDDNPSNSPFDDYTIVLIVTDDDGDSGMDSSAVVRINNLIPTLTGLSALPIFENDFTALTGTIHDIGTLDSFVLNINWGDPTSPNNIETVPLSAVFNRTQFLVQHQYWNNNPPGDQYTIEVEVVDDDTGASVLYTTNVSVVNVPPNSIALNFDGEINEGDALALNIAFDDPGRLDPHTVTVDWGDGYSEVYNLGPSVLFFDALPHIYADNNPNGSPQGVYTIIVTVDDGEAFDVVSSQVLVDDVDPDIALSGHFTNNSLVPYYLTLGAITDPGQDTVTQYVVHWGDGKTDTYGDGVSEVVHNLTVSHSYTVGVFAPIIVVDLLDEDGLHLACGTLQPPYVSATTLITEAGLGDAFAYDLVFNGGLLGTQPLSLSITASAQALLAEAGISVIGTTFTSPSLLKAGMLTTQIIVSNDGGSLAVNLVIKIKGRNSSNTPQIISQITATPNPAQVNKTVVFTAVATDKDGDFLSYYWDFGDGTDDGNENRKLTAKHTYAVEGTYVVTLVVDDGAHSQPAFQHLNMVVTPPAAPVDYQVTSLKLAFDFRRPERSSLIVLGNLTMPATFIIPDSTIRVEIPGSLYTQDFIMNAKGIGGDAFSLFSLKATVPGPERTVAKFTLHLKGVDGANVSLFQKLTALGYLNETTPRGGKEIPMPLSITLPGDNEQLNQIPTLYKGVKFKTGKASLIKKK